MTTDRYVTEIPCQSTKPALSLQEMARAEGWARITPGTQAPAQLGRVRQQSG